ncbi:alpha-amylase family protein [Paracoccus sp. 22332]|uniref:alpha-amylase family protein n=1 Tax=Paracoccus sp. 22332 TaxID=3453913 RepID=UPI003F8463E5
MSEADEWWKNAVIYGIDVERFCDSDGDGVGDFAGLTGKLDHLTRLGVTCVWLLPFFPSTNRDNGYDITDYMQVDPRYGSFDDFLDFVVQAGARGIRVILDLVAQHTSDRHPWFLSARHDARSPFRDYYVWTDHPPRPAPGRGPMFPGQEDSTWTHDPVAQQYYYHRFYHFQPSLNHENPAVWTELERIIDFWMSFGIAGFRIDAAAHMIEKPLDPQGGKDREHRVLRDIFRHVTARIPDALIMSEVDEDESVLPEFFDGRQMNAMLNFSLNNHLLHALAVGRARPLLDGLARLPPPPDNGVWANFLRNLDEADLERLDPGAYDETVAALGPDEDMRIFGRGLRRRLAPMLGGDGLRLRMSLSLLFAMPGAPLICYGDEIGMGEDLSQPGRNAVRNPMQWSKGRNGGFSTAAKSRLTQPVVTGAFGPERVNADDQWQDDGSLLNHVARLAAIRLEHPAIGRRECRPIGDAPDGVVALRYGGADHDLVILHNLSDKPARLDLDLGATCRGQAVALLGEALDTQDGRLRITLPGYDSRWSKWPH